MTASPIPPLTSDEGKICVIFLVLRFTLHFSNVLGMRYLLEENKKKNTMNMEVTEDKKDEADQKLTRVIMWTRRTRRQIRQTRRMTGTRQTRKITRIM